MKKRGLIELHFNWIFVLIAGAIIFVFFINIVNKQTEFSEIKASGTIVTNLESILTGAQVSTRTVNLIEMPKVDIGFECNRYFIGPVPRQTKANVIFAPGLLKGKKMITWALDWNVPYRITNFLYITDPQVRYVIIHNNSNEALANKINEELPKEMNKEMINVEDPGPIDFKNKNNYKVRFILLVGQNEDKVLTALRELDDMPDKDVTAVKLLDAEDLSLIPSTGTIEFFQKEYQIWKSQLSEGQKKTFYLKKESLFGALFAEDIEMYNCAMKKAFKKLNLVSEIYSNRSSTLMVYYSGSSCSDQHYTSNLNEIVQNSETQSKEFPQNTIGNINQIETTSTAIKDQNHNAQLHSCALIY